MARTRSNPRRQPTLRLRPPARTGWENNRRVVALTLQIITLQRRTATRVVDAILEIGRHMSTVRSTLERGE